MSVADTEKETTKDKNVIMSTNVVRCTCAIAEPITCAGCAKMQEHF